VTKTQRQLIFAPVVMVAFFAVYEAAKTFSLGRDYDGPV